MVWLLAPPLNVACVQHIPRNMPIESSGFKVGFVKRVSYSRLGNVTILEGDVSTAGMMVIRVISCWAADTAIWTDQKRVSNTNVRAVQSLC